MFCYQSCAEPLVAGTAAVGHRYEALADLPSWVPFMVPPWSSPLLPPAPPAPFRRVVGITIPILEQSSGSYLATLTDPSGRVIPGSTLTGLTLTLYTMDWDGALTIINRRNRQNVLNAGNVTVYETLQVSSRGTYNLRWRIQPADTTLYDVSLAFERHIAQFEWTWANGAGKQEVILVVQNLVPVP